MILVFHNILQSLKFTSYFKYITEGLLINWKKKEVGKNKSKLYLERHGQKRLRCNQ